MRLLMITAVLVLAAAFLPGCSASKERRLERATRTVVDRFAEIDADGNGQISKAELNAVR